MPLSHLTDPVPDLTLYRLRRIDWPIEFPPGDYAIRRGDDWLRFTLDEPMTAFEMRRIIRRVRSGRVRQVA